MHAPHEREVELAAAQAAHRRLHRHQRRRARRVERVAGTHEVEAVGDAAGDDVGDQAGRGVGVEGRNAALEVLAHELQVGFGELGMELLQDAERLVDDRAVLQDAEVAPVQVRALAQDHRGAMPLGDVVAVPRVGEGGAGDVKGQPLVGLAPLHGQRHHAVHHRLQPAARKADEPALLAVHPVVARGIRVVEDVHVPHVRGRVRDGVDARGDVLPVGVEVRSAGEDATHPDDGDVVRARLPHGQ